MPVVGQPVPHRHAGAGREGFHVRLCRPAELDAVEHAAEHPGGVPHGFLVAELGLTRAKVADVAALVVRGDLEGRPGPGGRLLEDQRDAAAGQPGVPLAHMLLQPQVHSQVHQGQELLGGQVGLLAQAASGQVHDMLLVLWCHQAGSRSIGQVMPPSSAAASDGDDLGPVHDLMARSPPAGCYDRPSPWPPRMITTGQLAWCAQFWLTEPSSASVNWLCPRLPTTSRSAPTTACSSTLAG